MPAHRPARCEPAAPQIRVCFLSANPVDTTALHLTEELREIRAKIRAAEYHDTLILQSRWAVRPDDLQQALLQERPAIVHFSGRGSQDEAIMLQADDGTPTPVSTTSLAKLFGGVKDDIHLVVLNACYSQDQAEAITQVIDCAVGIGKALGERASIKFVASFYRALGFRRSIQEAIDPVCAAPA